MSGFDSAKWEVRELRRRVAELTREQSEAIARFRQAAAAGRTGVWTVDFRTEEAFVDPALMAAMGYEEGALPERADGWAKLVHEDDLPAWARKVEACREGRADVYDHEFRMPARDGSFRWIHARGEVVRDEEGRPAKIVGVGMDVTERRLAEEDREELRRQLQQARQAESIGTLAGGIAHDFNNILAVILGNAQLALAKEAAGEPVADNVREMLTAAVRGRDIVRQILAFSRPEPGRRRPIPIESAVSEAVTFVRPFIPRQVDIRIESSAADTLVEAEASHIHQVLLNLCSNARDAMPEGGVITVSVRAERRESPFAGGHRELPAGDWIVLEVSDTGHGIEPENRDRVFDPFFTTKRVGHGTGLGLSMVYGIIRDHGGDVAADEAPGGGTVIRIHLPVGASPAGADEPPDGEAVRGKGRVLFVDDEESIVHVGTSMLTALGYEVVAHVDPAEALRAFLGGADGFDAVVTDQSMPELTGLRLARAIADRRPGTPVLLCTGYSDSVSDESLREAGVAELVMKPYTAGELSQSLSRALSGRA